MIPVFRPCVGQEEIDAVVETLRSGWIGAGPKADEFEREFAAFIGAPCTVAVNSCTAALHLALKVADVSGAEVITTPLTFVSTNHAILFNGGVPVFADVEPDTLNIDVEDVRRKLTSRTRAIVVVHYGGHACDMDPILQIAADHGLRVIEDAAHGCGGEYRGRKLGTLGDFGCYSFHAVKNLATGDGGMIVARDPAHGTRLHQLAWVGISRGTWDRVESHGYSWEYGVEELGFKYHMNDIAAALGLLQLAKLERTNGRRRYLAERYGRAMRDIRWLELPAEKDYARSCWHNYVVKVGDPDDRNPLIRHLMDRGISTSVHYIPNHLYAMYQRYAPDPLPVAEVVWKRIITLPLFPDLTEDEQDTIIEAIRAYRGS